MAGQSPGPSPRSFPLGTRALPSHIKRGGRNCGRGGEGVSRPSITSFELRSLPLLLILVSGRVIRIYTSPALPGATNPEHSPAAAAVRTLTLYEGAKPIRLVLPFPSL